MKRYLSFSRTFDSESVDKMIGSIILQYHVIEKGLTMPESTPGFGRERVISLCNDCIKCLKKHGQDDEQLNHAIGVILEYEDYHKSRGFILDNSITKSITSLRESLQWEVRKSIQKEITREEYFSKLQLPFHAFSNSRSSVRNYSDENVPISRILDALNLACNAPSACNRQSWRTYVFSDKTMIIRLLEMQGGARGFGHLANKLILVTGELGLFCNSNERNQVYIDGGIYSMNLLYAIHSSEIAACILNCSFTPAKEKEIKEYGKIRKSEVLISMIVCGIPPDNFKIASSPRYRIVKTNTVFR